MPLLFLLAGLILIVTGINGTTAEAGRLIKQDFTGPNNFFTWFFAILVAGLLGYIPTLKPLSYAFLVLVFVIIMLKSGSGFFAQFQASMRELNIGDLLTTGNTVLVTTEHVDDPQGSSQQVDYAQLAAAMST